MAKSEALVHHKIETLFQCRNPPPLQSGPHSKPKLPTQTRTINRGIRPRKAHQQNSSDSAGDAVPSPSPLCYNKSTAPVARFEMLFMRYMHIVTPFVPSQKGNDAFSRT